MYIYPSYEWILIGLLVLFSEWRKFLRTWFDHYLCFNCRRHFSFSKYSNFHLILNLIHFNMYWSCPLPQRYKNKYIIYIEGFGIPLNFGGKTILMSILQLNLPRIFLRSSRRIHVIFWSDNNCIKICCFCFWRKDKSTHAKWLCCIKTIRIQINSMNEIQFCACLKSFCVHVPQRMSTLFTYFLLLMHFIAWYACHNG